MVENDAPASACSDLRELIMTDLESVGPKKAKAPEKSAAKKRRDVAKAIGAGAGVALTAIAVNRILRKPAAKSRIVVPEERSLTSGSKIGAAAHRKLALLMKDSLSPEEVARMLATTKPSIVRRIRARSLYGVSFEGTWRVPTFQFRDGALLRGVEKVLPRLDSKLHPLEVIHWFSLPNADLVRNGKPVSPATWLERGADIDSVAALAAEVGSGL